MTKAVKAGQTQGTFDYDGDSGRTKKVGYIYTTSAVGTSGEMQLGLLDEDAIRGNPREEKIRGNPRSQMRYVFDFLTSFLDPKAEAAVVPQATGNIVDALRKSLLTQ